MYEYNLGLKFENITARYPQRTAIKFAAQKSISYLSLNNKANQFARYLNQKGVNIGDVVSISGTKNIYTYICVLACLKLGAAYSIIDDDSPLERLKKILSRCHPRAIFLHPKLKIPLTKTVNKLKCKIILNQPQKIDIKIKKFDSSNLDSTSQVTGAHPAYIMFTSGSTGFPKGAVMTHGNVLNLIAWSISAYDIKPKDIFTNVNPLYFDNSVFDFYSALFSGSCLVPFTREELTNPTKLVAKVDRLKCTSWFSVPSLLIYLDTMKALSKGKMKHIRRFIFGGEGYPKPKLKHLHELYSKQAKLFNVYGPTECTCICSSYQITATDFKDLNTLAPLGQIAPNFSYLILPPGKVGELCLLGPNVGKGYYNDPKRTQEKFVLNPQNKNFPEIMYKTGDLVKHNSKDGNICFVGRIDNQIKHMGYRIELDEIELALNRLKYISEAAVIHGYIRKLSHIIAVVASSKVESEIIQDLTKILPAYMIPNQIHLVKHLPKNPNGKIDRKKLSTLYFK